MSSETVEPIIYRASELGSCTKALVAKRLGYEGKPYPEGLMARFADGELHEGAIVAELEAGGDGVSHRQHECNLWISDGLVVQGHLDGVMDGRVLEIKTMSQSAWDSFVRLRWDTPGLIQKYKWQLSVYMLAMGMEATLIVKNKNTGEKQRHGVELPFYTLEQVQERVLAIEHEVASGILPALCDEAMYPCPFYYLHEDAETEVVSDFEIENLASQYKLLQANAVAADAAKTLVYRTLLQSMGDRKKVKTERVSVTVYEQNNPVKWDMDKMKSDGIDTSLYEIRTKGQRMRVQVKDEVGEEESEGE